MSGMTLEERLRELENDIPARIRWRVLRELGALPVQAVGMTDEDYLRCAMHLALDRREQAYGPGAAQELRVTNLSFDPKRFEALRWS